MPYVKPTFVLAEVTMDPNLSMPPLTPVPGWSGDGGIEIGPPASQPAEIGRTYVFTTGHCGFYSPIDFDGSYWSATAISVDPTYRAGNSSRGTMTLLDTDLAQYQEGTFAARLTRRTGHGWPWTCE